MTTQDIVNYYANLLIVQYRQKPRAYAMIQAIATQMVLPLATEQTILFSGIAASGTFQLNWNGTNTSTLNWNDTAATIQTALQAITGLSQVTVSGSIASQSLVVEFIGVPGIAELLTVPVDSLLDGSSNPVNLMVLETDVTLPVEVQNSYNVLAGTNIAQGVQLDVLGKYAGVIRRGSGFQGQPIVLDDADFWSLIRFATILNTAQSDLNTIQTLLHTFFGMNIFVFDFQNMHMGYMIDSALGTKDFAEMIVIQGLLPKPMGVQLASVIYAPHIENFFGFRTYFWGTYPNKPFNSYTNYNQTWTWLSYTDALVT